jgi:hypothetical protein
VFNIGVARKGTRKSVTVTVTGTATLLATANGNRKSLVLQNQSADSTSVFLGDAGVDVGTGYELGAGMSFTDDASDGPWYGISAGGDEEVHVLEVA